MRTVLRDLANVHQREVDPGDDPGACAVLLYIAADSPSIIGDPMIGELVHSAAVRVFRSFDAGSGFRWTLKAEGAGMVGQPLWPVSQAMLAGATARVLASKVDGLAPPPPEVIAKAIESAWSSVNPANRVALLPWSGWAMRDLSAATGQPMLHIADLQQVMKALDQSRALSEPSNPDSPAPDLDGGFALTAERSERPKPTAQSLRPTMAGASPAR